LGRVYVWPVATFDEDLELAIQTLKALREDEWLAEADPAAWQTDPR